MRSSFEFVIAMMPESAQYRYRGPCRFEPNFVDELPEDHPVNQAFLWYVEERYGEDGPTLNLDMASNLVHLYKELDPPQLFEVIGIQPASSERDGLPGELLGFDVSDYFDSLLFRGLDYLWFLRDIKDYPEEHPRQQIAPLVKLLQDHFQPLLNQNGLFQDASTAERYFSCVKALDRLGPGFVLEPDVDYQVLEVTALSTSNETPY